MDSERNNVRNYNDKWALEPLWDRVESSNNVPRVAVMSLDCNCLHDSF